MPARALSPSARPSRRESFVIEQGLKPAVLSHIDPAQNGFIPSSSTTSALISMFHTCLGASEATGTTIRTALLDFSKAFDVVDHHILITKLRNLVVMQTAVNHRLSNRQTPKG